MGRQGFGDMRVWLRIENIACKQHAQGQVNEDNALTDDGILEHDEKAGVVLPLDLEATVLILKFGECILDVFRLELLWETGEIEDASDGCRKTGEIGGHG